MSHTYNPVDSTADKPGQVVINPVLNQPKGIWLFHVYFQSFSVLFSACWEILG